MPTVNINRKVLEKIIGKKLSEEQLKNRISMLGTDLESITPEEIVVEIFPNRPDMLSEQGFGRALSSFVGVNTGLRKYSVKKSSAKVYVDKEMKNVRPYTVCALIKNLRLDDEKIREIIQIQEKLHITFCRRRKKAAIGIYPMERIRLPIYFTAKKPEDIVFRPLEWNKEINARQILNEHPTGVKYKELVEGMVKYAVFQDANGDILSFTPVINSHHTGKITDATKEAFLEVSGFDLHTANYVLNIMSCAFIDMGADVYSMEVVYPDKSFVTPDLSPRKMKISLGYINRWLGLDLKEKDFKGLLSKMGLGYDSKAVLIPCYRPDIIHPADVAEDIAIAYGYENFKEEIPSKATTAHEDDFEKFRKKVSYLLTGLNMMETSSYHLSNKETQFDRMNFLGKLERMKNKLLNKPDDFVELANSKSEEHTMLRYWMLPSLLEVLKNNAHNEYPQNLFESGYVFRLADNETGCAEKCNLACVLCSNDSNYTKIRQVLDYLFKSLGVKYEIRPLEHASFISGRAACVYVGGKNVGILGEINPFVLDNFAVEMPACGFEVEIGETFSVVNKF